MYSRQVDELDSFLSQNWLLTQVQVLRLAGCTSVLALPSSPVFLIYAFCYGKVSCAFFKAALRRVIVNHRYELPFPFVQFIYTFHFDLKSQPHHLNTFLFLLYNFDIA